MKIAACILLLVLGTNLLQVASETVKINGTLNDVYNNQTTLSNDVAFRFLFPTSQIGPRANLKLFVSAEKSRNTHPILVTTMIQEYGVVWRVPFNLSGTTDSDDYDTNYYFSFNRYTHRPSIAISILVLSMLTVHHFLCFRTICKQLLGIEYKKKRDRIVTITVSTLNPMFTNFQLSLYIEDNYELQVKKLYNKVLDPSTPLIHHANIPAENEFGIFTLTSSSPQCMSITILTEICPTISLGGKFKTDPDSNRLFQTANLQSSFTLSKDKFPQ